MSRAFGGELLGGPPQTSVIQAHAGRGDGGVSFKNKQSRRRGLRREGGAAEMASPGLVPASWFAFEQESRCRVTIRRQKAPGTCEAARPTTYGRKEKGEQRE